MTSHRPSSLTPGHAPSQPSPVKRRAALTLSLLALLNLLVWLLAFLTLRGHPLLLGTAALAYTLGLRHALDADHISAIDNVTRKLMQDGQRPLLVGLFFSLGHSTIVVLLSIVIALSAARIQTHFPAFRHWGGLIGTSVSATFLLTIAFINLLVLRGIVSALARIKRGEPFDEQDVDSALSQLGLLGRILRPIVALADRSWKMYGVGLLFGLGFDTATEVGLLGISAAAATQGLPTWAILIFPALFTVGMCLVDTADGILMLGAYGWAFLHPIRKLHYNLTITAASVMVATFIGALEVFGILADRLDLHGPFWDSISSLNSHGALVGLITILVFAASWAASALGYRLIGYAKFEQMPPAPLHPDS